MGACCVVIIPLRGRDFQVQNITRYDGKTGNII
jgi:hypothetical protein